MASTKIVLMTGSSSGIGLAMAKRLALDSNKRFIVIATVISFAEQDDLVAAVGAALNRTIFIKELNITNDDQIASIVDQVLKKHGRIDILSSPFLEIYCASKFATEGFLEGQAPVARNFNIWVSMIEPMFVNTGLGQGIFSGMEDVISNDSVSDDERQMATHLLKFFKHGRLFSTEDVASLMMEIIEDDKPNLRYQIPPEILTKGPIGVNRCDFSGEKLVKMNIRNMSKAKL